MSEKDKDKEPQTNTDGTDEGNTDTNGEEEEEEVVVKEKKHRKIQINVSRDKEIEALTKELAEKDAMLEREKEEREEREQKLEDEKTKIQEELTEKQAILEKQALEAFEEEKKQILELAKNSKLSDDQMAEIEERLTTPEKLETVKALITMLSPEPDGEGQGEKSDDKKPPSGKAPISTPPERRTDGEVFDDPESLMASLYWKAYYAKDNEVTVQERAEALRKINKLFQDLIGGKAWKQLKDGERLPEIKVTQCPKCFDIIVGTPDKCPKCGHDLQERLRKRGEEGSKW